MAERGRELLWRLVGTRVRQLGFKDDQVEGSPHSDGTSEDGIQCLTYD
jgi:hypothetical protein